MHYRSAPVLRRLTARVLDLAFSLLLTFIVAIPVVIVLLLASPVIALFSPDSAYEVGFAGAVLSYVIAYVVIEVFLLVRREGQTLGKGLMGLRVVPAGGQEAAALALPAAITRMLIIFVPFVLASAAGGNPDSGILNALAWMGLLSLITSLVLAAIPSGRRRAVHDLAARSRVVMAPKRRIEWKRDARMMVPGKIEMTKRVRS